MTRPRSRTQEGESGANRWLCEIYAAIVTGQRRCTADGQWCACQTDWGPLCPVSPPLMRSWSVDETVLLLNVISSLLVGFSPSGILMLHRHQHWEAQGRISWAQPKAFMAFKDTTLHCSGLKGKQRLPWVECPKIQQDVILFSLAQGGEKKKNTSMPWKHVLCMLRRAEEGTEEAITPCLLMCCHVLHHLAENLK